VQLTTCKVGNYMGFGSAANSTGIDLSKAGKKYILSFNPCSNCWRQRRFVFYL